MGFGLGGPWWRLQFEGDAADTAGVQHASPEPSSNIRVWRERGRWKGQRGRRDIGDLGRRTPPFNTTRK